jgi:ComF family protein
MRKAARFLFSFALELVFPRTCVLCGKDFMDEPGKSYPLCKSCEERIVPLEGPRCPICGKPLISEQGVCMRCREREFGFDSAYPLWMYSGDVKNLIIAYKMRSVRPLACFFAGEISKLLGAQYPGVTVVPVPFRKGKLRKTGWDQVEDIVRILARNGIPVSRCLERLSGVSQKVLDYSDRLSNLTGRIRVRERASVPSHVVLLDDVLTTGATLSECARVLKSRGAKRVDAIVLAAD